HRPLHSFPTRRSSDLLSPNGFDAVVRNNLHQVFYCCSAVRPIMAEQGGGRIINISSVAGLRGTPGLGACGAAKAGVINLTETLADRKSTRLNSSHVKI